MIESARHRSTDAGANRNSSCKQQSLRERKISDLNKVPAAGFFKLRYPEVCC
jgi:hypothetical protein